MTESIHSNDGSQDNETISLHSKQTQLRTTNNLAQSVKKFNINLKKTNSSRINKGFLDARTELIQNYWKEFREHYERLQMMLTDEELGDLPFFINDEYTRTEESYLDAITYIKQKLHELYPATNPINIAASSTPDPTRRASQQLDHPTNISTQRVLKLPPVKIPKFNGDLQFWPSFYNLFKSVVHDNQDISPVQKLHYLKSSLEGEPENLIRNLHLTNLNYEPAWEQLLQRYNNKRILVSSHLDAILDLSKMRQDTSKGIKQLLDTTNESIISLQGLGIDTSTWDPIIIHILTKRLTTETYQLWEESRAGQQELPTLDQFKEHLEARHRTLEVIDHDKRGNYKTASTSNYSRTPDNPRKQVYHTKTTKPTPTYSSCVLCKGSHNIRSCEQFKSKEPNSRFEIAKRFLMCTNCLSVGHYAARCPSDKRCLHCSKRHHTLLHQQVFTNPNKPSTSTAKENVSSEDSSENVNTFHVSKLNTHKIILATALVRISSDSGNELVVRALLDQASEASFITEAVARRLNLQFKPTTATISGIGEGATTSLNSTSMRINAHFQNKINLNVNAYILKSISGILPSTKLSSNSWPHTKLLKLADPSFDTPERIDLLLGIDVYNQILMNDIIRGPMGTPLAQKTKLGWVLSGPTSCEQTHNIRSNITIISQVTRVSLEQQLKSFWEIEEILTQPMLTEEETICQDIFNKTHSRNKDGRFIVKLPFVEGFGSKVCLGRSRDIAVSRLYQLEQRFKKNPKFKEDYTNCLQEYLDLSHIEPAFKSEGDLVACTNKQGGDVLNCCYIPHHAVTKESSTTSKTRVVFDASRPTKSGNSLNDCLLNGPTLQEDISSITLRWRKHKYVITADIEKMYRQILVDEKHAEFQRIVWRWNHNEPIKEFKLLTLTFGTKSAAYLAVKCLQTLGEAKQSIHPEAAEVILHDFYVDDLLTGADTTKQARIIRNQVSNILHEGGFELRKWVSNEPSIIPDQSVQDKNAKLLLNPENDNTIKTLGLYWDPVTDSFSFKVTLTPTATTSKRAILSDIAKLYDPNGWLAPITIRAKILLQSLWLTGLTWDEPVPTSILSSWIAFRNALHFIEDIRMPRWINTFTNHRNVQLHCFSDASNHAYAAAVYIRVMDECGICSVQLLTAKTKVAPVKQVSLPRLELCGVVLGTKLMKHVISSMKMPVHKLVGWTDSSIVLHWLRSHPSKWKTFVANRISDIHRSSNTTIWRHVPTKDNPADAASRGIKPQELKENQLWWYGPKWLHDGENEWPILKSLPPTNLEERNIVHTIAVTSIQTPMLALEHYSTYTRLIRTTTYVFRFIKHLKRQYTPSLHLTPTELQQSLIYWVKISQKTEFSHEIQTLQADQVVNKSSKIANLNPILDDQDMLRVGGRIAHAHIKYETRHPIILSSRHHLTKLLINNYHRLTLHGGTQVISALMREKYWIVDARNTIRNCISKCITCRRHQATIRTQLMGQLPAVRINISRPFQHVGVDYAGPFEVKLHGGRTTKHTKAYVCLFVCMAIKAVHLELASDLSTSSFLAAFKRFISRRGLCSSITSDNGTNFVGAARVLKTDFIKTKIEPELAKLFANEEIEWKFIPPGAPNFGGLWEAGIKSVKHHLKRVMGCSSLTYEEFTTTLTQIEGVLNSRPLCPMTSDPSDLEALTPGHFLIGGAILTPPEPNLLNVNLHRLNRWQRIQQLYQSFWKRWSLEYVTRQQQRPKWITPQPNLAVDDMVLVKHSDLPPAKWMLGRIVDLHPGQDGAVRVVTVRTKNGETLKAVSKLCTLPTQADDAMN